MSWRDEPYFVCRDCDAVTSQSALLVADHPFSLDDHQIHGCPACREMDLARTCDVADCPFEMAMGGPTPEGYHFTCYPHRNETKEQR